jgi:hypothetical protein
VPPRACYNCFESLADDGPRGRGDTDEFALLRDPTEGRVWAFCSPECRSWWFDVCGHSFLDSRDILVAEVTA